MLWVTGQFLLLAVWASILLSAPPATLSTETGLPVPEIVGLTVALTGIGIATAALIAMRGVTPLPEPRSSINLVTDGVYRYVRHPMYGGLMLMTVGLSLSFLSIPAGAAALALAAFLSAKSRYEEGRLKAHYPEYTAYAASTRRFIPFLW